MKSFFTHEHYCPCFISKACILNSLNVYNLNISLRLLHYLKDRLCTFEGTTTSIHVSHQNYFIFLKHIPFLCFHTNHIHTSGQSVKQIRKLYYKFLQFHTTNPLIARPLSRSSNFAWKCLAPVWGQGIPLTHTINVV